MKTISGMHSLFFRSFVYLIVSSLIASGCALRHPASPFHFTAPINNQRFALNAEINIKLLSTLGVTGGYDSIAYRVEYQVRDNGNSIIPGTFRIIAPSVRDIVVTYPATGRVAGAHLFQARARVTKISNSESSRWFETQVCVWIGANAPPSFTCTVFGWPEPLESAPTNTPGPSGIIQLEDPLLQLDPTPTETSTATLIPYAPPTKKANNNDNGDNGSGGSSGGSGPVCKGLDKDKCSVTSGCTWDGSSCNVK